MIYRFRKEELEAHLNKNALWAIVYGDMMSYLMILFLVMLSYQLSENIKHKRDKVEESLVEIQRVFGGQVSPEMAARAKELDQLTFLQQKVREVAPAEDVKMIITEQWAKINLSDKFLFDSGHADLKEGAVPLLKMIAQNQVSEKNLIQVEGHTDNVPLGKHLSYKNNWELSMARAYTVLKKLQDSGMDPKRLSGIGYGEYQPVASNDTPEGRAKNRRIEIKVLRSRQ